MGCDQVAGPRHLRAPGTAGAGLRCCRCSCLAVGAGWVLNVACSLLPHLCNCISCSAAPGAVVLPSQLPARHPRTFRASTALPLCLLLPPRSRACSTRAPLQSSTTHSSSSSRRWEAKQGLAAAATGCTLRASLASHAPLRRPSHKIRSLCLQHRGPQRHNVTQNLAI